MALAPLDAPLIGGVLETAFGWRSNFVVLFVFGAAAWLHDLGVLLPETVRKRAPEPVSVASILRSLHAVSSADRGFVVHLRHRDMLPVRTVRLDFLRSSGLRAAGHLPGCRRSPSVWCSRFGSSGYLVGTLIAARFVMRWGSRPHHGRSAPGGDGVRRPRDGRKWLALPPARSTCRRDLSA